MRHAQTTTPFLRLAEYRCTNNYMLSDVHNCELRVGTAWRTAARRVGRARSPNATHDVTDKILD